MKAFLLAHVFLAPFIVFTIAALAQLVVGYLVDNHSVRTVFSFVAGLQAVFFVAMIQLDGVGPRRGAVSTLPVAHRR